MSAQQPVLYEQVPVAMTMYIICWPYSTGTMSQPAVTWTIPVSVSSVHEVFFFLVAHQQACLMTSIKVESGAGGKTTIPSMGSLTV